MRQLQPRRMQRLTREPVELRDQCRAGARWKPTAAAIHRITNNRIPDMRQVHTDLMRAATLELDMHERVRTKTLHQAIVCHRWTPVAAHGHARALTPMATDRLIDR